MRIGHIRHLMLFSFKCLFLCPQLFADSALQVSYQHSNLQFAYDADGKVIPLVEDYASFDCPAVGANTLFNTVSSEIDLLTANYSKRSRKGFGYFLSLSAIRLTSLTLVDLSFLSPDDQLAAVGELSQLGCEVSNARQIYSLGEVSVGVLKVFSFRSFELESSIAVAKPLSQIQPELAVNGAEFFLDLSLIPSIGNTLRFSLPVVYRFGLPANFIDKTYSIKVSYQSTVAVEVGVSRRLIAIRRAVYDAMGEAFSRSDSINGQLSFAYDTSILVVGFSKTIAGQNALLEDNVQFSIVRFL